jgi:misacylated tRNA(Ala) deacylase
MPTSSGTRSKVTPRNEYATAVTGGNMEPLSARMDFEFDPLPAGFGETIERRVNEELAAARPIEIVFLPRETAVEDEDLIRTKVPPSA